MHRSSMSSEERGLRSRLCRKIHQEEFLRATPAVRQRVCGKKGCSCVKGKKHVSLFLVHTLKGKPQQLYIPRSMEPEVRRWVKQSQDVRRLLEKLSEIYWRKIKKGEL